MNKPLLHYDVIKTFIVYIAITNFIKSPGISVVASPMQHPMSDSWSSGHQGTLFVPVIPEQPPGLTNQLVHMEPGYAVVSQLVPIVYAHYAPVNIRTTFAPAHRIRKAKIKTLRAPARDLALSHQGASSKPPGAHPTPIVQEDSKKITIELDESEPSSKELDTDGTPRDQIRRCKKKENQEIAQQSLQKDVVENQKPNVLSSSGEIPSLSSQVGEAQTDPLQSPEIMETNKAIETSKMENPTKPDSPEKLQPVLRYEDHKAVPTTTEIWHKVGKKKAAKGYRLPSSTALQNGNHESLLSGKSKELEKQEPGIVQTGDQPKLDHTDEEIKDIGDAKNSNKESDSLDGSQNEPSIDEANRTEMDKLAIGSKSGVGVQRSTKKQTKNRRIQQVMTSEDKKALESFDLLDIFVNKSEKENGKKPKTKKKAASLSKNPKIEENNLITNPNDIIVDKYLSTDGERDVAQIFEEIFAHPQGITSREVDEMWKSYQTPSTSTNEPVEVGNGIGFELEEKYKNLWEDGNLDSNLMKHVSYLLKVNDKEDHMGIEKMDYKTFQMLVSAALEDQELFPKIYKFLELNLGATEAFRRMLALSRQLVQMNIPKLKRLLIKWSVGGNYRMSAIFEGAKSGRYEKTFDMYGDYGISQSKKVISNESYRNKLPESHFFLNGHYNNALGKNEMFARAPPAVNFDPWLFKNSIARSSYRNSIHSKNLISSIESNGISANRVLTVILILGLEDEDWLSSFSNRSMLHHMAKVLFRVLSKNEYNHLPWHETAERKWLIDHYQTSYIPKFQELIKILEIHQPKSNPRVVPRASYPIDYTTAERLVLNKNKNKTSEEDIYYMKTNDKTILDAETFSTDVLAAKLRLLEPGLENDTEFILPLAFLIF